MAFPCIIFEQLLKKVLFPKYKCDSREVNSCISLQISCPYNKLPCLPQLRFVINHFMLLNTFCLCGTCIWIIIFFSLNHSKFIYILRIDTKSRHFVLFIHSFFEFSYCLLFLGARKIDKIKINCCQRDFLFTTQ